MIQSVNISDSDSEEEIVELQAGTTLSGNGVMRLLTQREAESEIYVYGRPHSAGPYFDPIESETWSSLVK